MNSQIWKAWGGNVPPILYIAMEVPDSVALPLSGTGTARMSLDAFLKDLQHDIKNQTGHFWAYHIGHYQEEMEAYTLETWQVLEPNDGTYEAVIILYYRAMYPYYLIKTYMGENLAAEYLAHNAIAEVFESEILEQ